MADITGRSFDALLMSTTGTTFYPVGYFDDGSVAGDGWLVQNDGAHRGAAFTFDFIEQKGDRLHYHISGALGTRYAGAKLGVSLNGYLGFYSVATVTDFWKVELLPDSGDPETFQFILRDPRGYRVGSTSEPASSFWTSFMPRDRNRQVKFLNVEVGDTVYFQGRILDFP